MIDLEVAQPIGARTCCNANRRQMDAGHIWLDDAVEGYTVEYQNALRGNLDPKLTRAEHKDAMGVLESLRRKASRGHIEVGSGPEFSARIIQSVSFLLELRPKFSRGAPPPRLFRLYYAEPRSIEGVLLPLVLATKENSSRRDEQNASIIDAMARGRTWQLMNGAKR